MKPVEKEEEFPYEEGEKIENERGRVPFSSLNRVTNLRPLVNQGETTCLNYTIVEDEVFLLYQNRKRKRKKLVDQVRPTRKEDEW